MAKYSANPAPFNHVTDAAPEYVDVILWHRVALVLGALVIALAGLGYGVFALISTGDEGVSSPLAVNEITQQEPPSAVPTSAGESSVASAVAQQTTPIAEDIALATPVAQAAEKVAQTESKSAQAETLARVAAPAQQKQASTHPDFQVHNTQVHTTILVPAVKRALITDSIQGREPGKPVTDTASLTRRDAFTLHQFIDIHGRAGDTLTWKWKHNGKPSTTVRIRVGTNTWRGHASKHFNPKLAGDWQVDVIDQHDILLARSEFHLGK